MLSASDTSSKSSNTYEKLDEPSGIAQGWHDIQL